MGCETRAGANNHLKYKRLSYKGNKIDVKKINYRLTVLQ